MSMIKVAMLFHTGPLSVPVANISPGLMLHPLLVWCASCCVSVQYLWKLVTRMPTLCAMSKTYDMVHELHPTKTHEHFEHEKTNKQCTYKCLKLVFATIDASF